MSLENIEYGSLASSELLNNNFEYLDNRISGLSQSQSSEISSIYSSIANISNAITQQNETLTSNVSDLQNYAIAIRNDVNAHNSAPDYSRAIGITLPYTVRKNGYVYAGVDGTDTTRYVCVNGKRVHGHCGYSGGYAVYSGSLFRVSTNDVVTCNNTAGNYYFYPMKGV